MTAAEPATTPRLDHAGLTFADLEASLVFYHELLQMPILSRGEGQGRAAGIAGARVAFAKLDAGEGQMIELLQYRHPESSGTAVPVSMPGGAHVAIAINDLDRLLERLAGSGFLPLTDTPVRVVAPERGRWNGARLVYVLDPDRHVIELVEFPAGTPAKSVRSGTDSQTLDMQ
jgi:glyoxylase I family protein